MKNLLHTIASFCFVIWLIGFTAYDVALQFHLILLAGLIAAIVSVRMPKAPMRKKTTG